METLKKALVAALVLGLAASIALAGIEALHHSDIVAIAQFPGLAVASQVAYGADFAVQAIMVLVNAACYAVLFGGLILLVRTASAARRNVRLHE